MDQNGEKTGDKNKIVSALEEQAFENVEVAQKTKKAGGSSDKKERRVGTGTGVAFGGRVGRVAVGVKTNAEERVL